MKMVKTCRESDGLDDGDGDVTVKVTDGDGDVTVMVTVKVTGGDDRSGAWR